MNLAKLFILVVCLTSVTVANASTVVRTSDQFELSKEQSIDVNFLGVGSPVSVAGSVEQDVTLIGNQVVMAGYVGGDFLSLGIISQIGGVVEGDARIVSADLTISDTVKGDLVVLAGSVDVLSTAKITGDVLVYANSAKISGEVGGNILGSTRDLFVDGLVGGSVDVHAGQLTLGSGAAVGGSVRYTSKNLLVQAIDAAVSESISRNDPVTTVGKSSLGSTLLLWTMILFATMFWFLLSRRTLTSVIESTSSNLFCNFLVGLAALFVVPVIVFVLSLSVIGVYASFLFLSIYITTVLLAVVAMPAVLGYSCVKILKFKLNLRDEGLNMLLPAIGAFLCLIIYLLPVVGIFFLFAIFVIVFGGMMNMIANAAS